MDLKILLKDIAREAQKIKTEENFFEMIKSEGLNSNTAIVKLYKEYKTPFYFIALSIIKNPDLALKASVEAFRRIINNVYKYDEELNAQYWIYDVISTLSSNIALAENVTEIQNNYSKASTAQYIKIFSNLEAGDIAAIMGAKKSDVIKELNQEYDAINIKEDSLKSCPDYFELVFNDEETGVENFSETERNLTQKKLKKYKSTNYTKRILLVIIIVAFLGGAIGVLIQLFNKNFGSDVERNLLGEDVLIQFDNKKACTQLNDYLFYCGPDNKLYRRNLVNNDSKCISEDYPKELINDGEFVYYRNYKDGYMYRINKEGKEKVQLCDVPGTSLAIYEDRIYFSAKEGIYSLPTSGGKFDDAELVLDTSTDANLYCVDMEIDEQGNVFFAGGIGGGVHHITEYNSAPSVEGVFTEEVYNICIDGSRLYFDAKDATGKILLYCLDLQKYYNNDTETRVVPFVVSDSKGENIILSTGAFYVYNGNIYFTGDKSGQSIIYMLDSNGNQKELLTIPKGSSYDRNNLSVTDIYISEDVICCYASDGKAKGARVFFMSMQKELDNSIIIFEG